MNEGLNKHYENLSRLYLRLKGYFVTNLIIHSEKIGNNESELDILGIRMPHHSQDDRKVNVVDYLKSSNERIEIIVADVKNTSNPNKVKFNKGLKNNDSSIEKLVKWVGVSDNNDEIIKKFKEYLNYHSNKDLTDFATFCKDDLSIGKFTFKFTFFCPSLNKWEVGGYKYIHGEEIFYFIYECLNTDKEVDTCSRLYSYDLWNEYKPYISFFKEAKEKVTKTMFEERFV
ncbi:hypothetical protein [Flavobacterium litorale]|uniref:Uncharacterized protein n=1 Tax=Flavobacterium litorale TaxID=2856519 RepID=A0ABX8VEC7_9FLAO|nr:hypothetical protein [Flavobacterium litorale]QYJ68981.1 hypothetical protein K1I41_03595 [Flavobacterium litorale]